jgi:hypothetical protein
VSLRGLSRPGQRQVTTAGCGYRQTCCHRQLPKLSQTRACRHCLVPTGGTVGGLIGAIDGAVTGQTAGGQIGGRSIALSQSGCIWPSTHWQMHDAVALRTPIARKRTAPTIAQIRRFIKAPKRPILHAIPQQSIIGHKPSLVYRRRSARFVAGFPLTTRNLTQPSAPARLAILSRFTHNCCGQIGWGNHGGHQDSRAGRGTRGVFGRRAPDIDRVTACMVAKRAQLSPECKRFFRPDPPDPVAVTAPPAGRPVNIRPRTTKPAKPVAAKPASAKPASAKKPAPPKTKKPAKPPTAT